MATSDSQKCFICLSENILRDIKVEQDINKKNIKGDICVKFLTFLRRYLKFPWEADFLSTNAHLNCCENCLIPIESFCEMYQNLQLLELNILGVLSNITRIMKSKPKEDVEQWKFRKVMINKLEEKRIRRFPRVALTKINSVNTDIGNDAELIEPNEKLDFGVEESENLIHINVKLPCENFSDDYPDETYNIWNDDGNSCQDFSEEEVTIFPENTDLDLGITVKVEAAEIAVSETDGKPTEKSRDSNKKCESKKTASRPRQSNLHKQSKHRSKRSNENTNIRIYSNNQCLMCSRIFRKPHQLFDHMLSHTKETPNFCPICAREFSTSAVVEVHLRRVHGKGDTSKNKICHICGQVFFTTSEHSMHFKAKHTSVRDFQCDKCGKSFYRQKHLREHQETHKDQRLFKCVTCKKNFTSARNLQDHEKRVHLGGGRRRVCDICEKVLKCNAYDLRIHKIRVHGFVNDEQEKSLKIFKCSHKGCSRTFYRKHELTVHQRIHSGERPHKCDQCDKAFPQRTHLVIHKMSHEGGVKPHMCKFCGNRFSQKFRLTAHEAKCEATVAKTLV